MKTKNVELLSPAGSFESAYYAFVGGADAVYLGLSDYSARKSARNFTTDQLRRLLTIAREQEKKIYVTMNTVLCGDELADALNAAYELYEFGIDAVIIQDIGFAALLQKMIPELEIHASTQMAVHTIAGVKMLQTMGFKRVVLSREVTLTQIKKIRKAVPEMELEVFIHGALCYSFSGLCLASGMILGRSGNRGECAQMCRSYYNRDGKDGFYFSCNDLALYEKVRELEDAGVVSFKIEGRMKSPEYVFNTAQLYRSILDGHSDDNVKHAAKIPFSRTITKGFYHHPHGENLIDSEHPGHRGVKLGVVQECERDRFKISLVHNIGYKDGLLFFQGNNALRPFKGAVEAIYDTRGKERRTAKKGETVHISMRRIPEVDDEIFLISSRNQDLKAVNAGRFKPYKIPCNIEVTINQHDIMVRSNDIVYHEGASIEMARKESNTKERLKKLFSQSDESLYTLGKIHVVNNSTHPDAMVFIPPSQLKRIKNDWYLFLDEKKKKLRKNLVEKIIEQIVFPDLNLKTMLPSAADRSLFAPENSEIPFAYIDDLEIEKLSVIDGNAAIPVLPVLMNEDAYFEKLLRLVKTNSRKKFVIGLSNLSHLLFAKELSSFENVSFFIDFPLYTANRATLKFFIDHLGEKLLFVYAWLEGYANTEWENLPVVEIDKSFSPPLFIAQGCFEKHNSDGCPKNCSKSFHTSITNRDRNFEVITKNCISFLFLK